MAYRTTFMLRLCCIFAALFQISQGLVSQRSIYPEIQKSIDDFIKNVYLPTAGISGMGLAVVQNDGEVLYTTGYGLADHEKGIPNGNGTQFLVGSVTKSFTSAIVLKVLSEKFPELGVAVLDLPIRQLIPAFNFTLIDRFRSEHVTFHDLLSHRLCFFREDLQQTVEVFNTSAEIVYRQRYAEEICGVRTEFHYNNQMYVTAGEIIAAIANRSYEDLMQDLLTEIGMLNSTLVKRSDDFSNMPYRAQPYYILENASHPINPELIKRVTLYGPAGGLYTTPDDMVKYMSFHLNFGKVNDKQVIPEELMRLYINPAMHLPDQFFKNAEADLVVTQYAYGLGLFLASFDGWQYNHHGGYFPPYHSLMSLFPRLNITIFTSSNQGPVLLDPMILHVFIHETLRGGINATEKAMQVWKQYDAINQEKDSKKNAVWNQFLLEQKNMGNIKRQNEEVVGEYGSGTGGELEILEMFNNETNTDQLFLRYGKWAHGWLEYVAGTLYKIKWTTDYVQDNYAAGDASGENYCTISNGTLTVVTRDEQVVYGTFQLGVNLDNLPPIPWDPESC